MNPHHHEPAIGQAALGHAEHVSMQDTDHGDCDRHRPQKTDAKRVRNRGFPARTLCALPDDLSRLSAGASDSLRVAAR